MDKINIPDSRPNDRYNDFERSVVARFDSLVNDSTPLFRVDVEDLWDVYINNIPEEGRSHYNCNACKYFINRFGKLVAVNEDGTITSVMWDENNTPEFFKKSVEEMRKVVEKSRIKTVFKAQEITLGIPETGEWTHLHTELSSSSVCLNKSRLLTAKQVMAEKSEDYRMLRRAISEYSMDTVEQAINILDTEALYRSEKCLGVAKWFKDVKVVMDSMSNSIAKENIVWLAVATAPNGFCHVKSSMIGTLLDDIEAGMSFDLIKRRFDEKMHPSNYMRSQSAPTLNQTIEAEKVVEKLGIANSLLRRYASLNEVPENEIIWASKMTTAPKVESRPTAGMFAHLAKQKEQPKAKNMDLPATVMTWDKFSRTVLPTADTIEAMIDNPGRLMALITASDDTSENILQWNNKFSWYYHSGIDGEIKKRVELAGGKYEDNEIRCSLIWEGYTDLDLHCITPRSNEIYYGNKAQDGGWLDIDMNGGSHRELHPVENIRWIKNAPNGIYKFIVNNYAERGNGVNPFKVELEVNGQIFVFSDVANSYYRKKVFEFEYENGRVRMLSENVDSVESTDNWNIPSNEFVKVNAIIKSPNMWGEESKSTAGDHRFFILEGCKDLSEGKGKGFFNEMLKPELRQIRKTLDAYTSATPIDNLDGATACGLGYTKDSEWGLTLRVKSGNSTRLIKIDRFD